MVCFFLGGGLGGDVQPGEVRAPRVCLGSPGAGPPTVSILLFLEGLVSGPKAPSFVFFVRYRWKPGQHIQLTPFLFFFTPPLFSTPFSPFAGFSYKGPSLPPVLRSLLSCSQVFPRDQFLAPPRISLSPFPVVHWATPTGGFGFPPLFWFRAGAAPFFCPSLIFSFLGHIREDSFSFPPVRPPSPSYPGAFPKSQGFFLDLLQP